MSQASTTGFLTKIKALGPGLLFAGAAIGVSHLVQSTRAGASYGIELMWAVALINVLKYPFFEFGPRYTAVTGESLLDGYKKLGKWVIPVYLIMTFGTMFTIQAAVTIVTAGIASTIFGWDTNLVYWSAILLGVCLIILLIGHYSLLDRVIKFIIVLLSLATIVALIAATGYQIEHPHSFSSTFEWNRDGIIFLIALMGWMPAPIDLSVWSSLWSMEKEKEQKHRIDLNNSLFDFRTGYWGAAFLAVCFLLLGAFIMHPTGEVFSGNGTIFANQLISIYTTTLGRWAYVVIAIAAFATMFSTTITCLDAFPRVLSKTTELEIKSVDLNKHFTGLYWFWILIVTAGTLLLLSALKGHMGTMVTIATTLSFLTAPVFAIINYKVVTNDTMPEAARPKGWLKYLSWAGILFLVVFSVIFLIFWFK